MTGYGAAVGFLDRAKKLAEQAKDMAEGALADVTEKTASTSAGPPASTPSAPPSSGGAAEFGTPYVPGMLGRPGWREQGFTDPAAVLPIEARDQAGVPRSTRSEIVEEPYGMGRRWTSGGRSAALLYQLYPEHKGWQAPGGTAPSSDVTGASTASLPDGRTLVFVGGDPGVVLEAGGLDPAAVAALTRAVADQV